MKNLLTIGILGWAFVTWGQFGEYQNITDEEFWPGNTIKADINDDGYDDLVSVSLFSNGVYLMINQKDGRFSSPEKIICATSGIYYQETKIQALDVNADNQLDILLGDSNVQFYVNRQGIFSETPDFEVKKRHSFVHADDIDKDGDIDLIFEEDNSLVWHINDGNNHFLDSIVISNRVGTYTQLENLLIGDLDNDGDKDIVTKFSDFSGIHIYQQNTNETWEESIYNLTADEIASLTLADMDNDGLLDIYYRKGIRMLYLRNQQGSSFSLPIEISINFGQSIEQEQFKDLDNDGDLDRIILITKGKVKPP